VEVGGGDGSVKEYRIKGSKMWITGKTSFVKVLCLFDEKRRHLGNLYHLFIYKAGTMN
jgi:hypothetical protein